MRWLLKVALVVLLVALVAVVVPAALPVQSQTPSEVEYVRIPSGRFLTSPTPEVGARFGSAAAGSPDGRWAAISEPYNLQGGRRVGRVHLYASAGTTLTPVATIQPSIVSSGSSMLFGASVAMNDTTLVVGAPGWVGDGCADNNGKGGFFVYKQVGGAWTETAVVPGQGINFTCGGMSGRDLELQGNRLVVRQSDGILTFTVNDDGSVTPVGTPISFGTVEGFAWNLLSPMALSPDGEALAVKLRIFKPTGNEEPIGLFRWSASGWQLTTLVRPNPLPGTDDDLWAWTFDLADDALLVSDNRQTIVTPSGIRQEGAAEVLALADDLSITGVRRVTVRDPRLLYDWETGSIDDYLTGRWGVTTVAIRDDDFFLVGSGLGGRQVVRFSRATGQPVSQFDVFGSVAGSFFPLRDTYVEGLPNVEASTGLVLLMPLSALTADDTIDPIVTGVASPVANAAGWNRTAVTIEWIVDDPTANVPAPVTVSVEGAGQVVTSESACDPAGNCSTGSVTVSIDLTAPVLEVASSLEGNGAGWNNTAITLTPTCSDGLSGVAVCPEPVVFAAEGAGQVASFSAVDVAGNVASLSSRVVNIDTTAPVVSLVGPADGSSVLESDYVVPTCTASDALSGLDGVCSVAVSDPVVSPGRIVLTATATASDAAGNAASVSSTFTVLTDVAGPVINVTASPEASDGWWNAPVTFSFSCTDPTGVAGCPAPVTVSGEGAGQSFDVSAADLAGNETVLTVSGVNIDLTRPTVTVVAPTQVGPLDTLVITCAASDALSGVASSVCEDVSMPAAELLPGANVFEFSATDVAGNVRTVTVTVTLVVPTNPAPTVRADMGVLGLNEIGFQTNVVVLTGSFSDPNGPGPFTASVRWTANGQFTPLILNNASQFVAGYIYGSSGVRTVTVRVCDAQGACGTDDVVVRSAVSQKITPIRECVIDRGAGTNPRFQARWGYNNPAPFAIAVPSIPVLENTFTGAPFLRGQPQIFQPGNQRGVFTTNFQIGNHTWRINANTATANASSPRC